LGGESNVLEGAQGRKKARGLKGSTESSPRPLVNRIGSYILPLQFDSAFRRNKHSRNEIEKSRLACPVGADYTEHFALADRQRHVIDDACAADLEAEMLNSEHGLDCHSQFLLLIVSVVASAG
jgi:hypothetical protein